MIEVERIKEVDKRENVLVDHHFCIVHQVKKRKMSIVLIGPDNKQLR